MACILAVSGLKSVKTHTHTFTWAHWREHKQQIIAALGQAVVACYNADCQSDTVGGLHNASLFRQAPVRPTSLPLHLAIPPLHLHPTPLSASGGFNQIIKKKEKMFFSPGLLEEGGGADQGNS